jgi:ABC-type transporter Mla MlaB component
MLRIEKVAEDPRSVTFAVAGDIDREHLPALKKVVEEAEKMRRRVTLDLHDVTLVDRESLRFLAAAREEGLRLSRCPAYVRKWVTQECRAEIPKKRKKKEP